MPGVADQKKEQRERLALRRTWKDRCGQRSYNKLPSKKLAKGAGEYIERDHRGVVKLSKPTP